MLNKLSYLASVSVLASIVMCQAGQAMDPSDEKPISCTKSKQPFEENPILLLNNSATQDISNAIYYNPEGEFGRVDPRKGLLRQIAETTGIYYIENVGGKIETFFKLQRQVRSGKYDELAGEVIEFLIASLAGETQKSLFGKASKELDPKILYKASKKLVDQFLKHLSKNNDLYGELPDGTRVTIYNR